MSTPRTSRPAKFAARFAADFDFPEFVLDFEGLAGGQSKGLIEVAGDFFLGTGAARRAGGAGGCDGEQKPDGANGRYCVRKMHTAGRAVRVGGTHRWSSKISLSVCCFSWYKASNW